MSTKRDILVAFILLMALILGVFACQAKYHYRKTEGIIGTVGGNIDIDPIVPIEGSDDRLVYPVKFVCGDFMPEIIAEASDPEAPLSPGTYFTAINIVNPIDGAGDATLDIRATQTFTQDSGSGDGIVGSPVTETLAPFHGLEIDCSDIRELLGDPLDLFLKGFVLVETTQPLSVVPVYSVQSVDEDLTTQSGECSSLARHARFAIGRYLWMVAFFTAGSSAVDCDDLSDAYQILDDNTERCRAVCGDLPCPSKPLRPGQYPGTESCTVVP